MISACASCGQTLNLTDAQRQKIENTLAALPPGKSLKFNCPHCSKPIEMKQEAPSSPEKKEAVQQEKAFEPAPGSLEPPLPPDLGWLERGDLGRGEVVEDVPQVLILIQDEGVQSSVVQLFDDMGYKPVLPRTAEDAIQRMRFSNFAAVVLHSTFEGSLDKSIFHEHMRTMTMTGRRYIYYVLIGPEFHTMYNLEALSHSANLVINDNEMSAFPLVLKKGFRDYDELFGPYLAALESVGKK